ncbi:MULTISPECIES: VOC family protein [Actinomadura]|nr:VOC family protein [Actinomadura sp. J1-007]MWK38574.1 VOC family protein [Actinomadura sp. J1-007]
MTLQRMDNIGITVNDLDAVIAFFLELGLELEGKALIEDSWAARVVGLDEQRVDIAMLRVPGGHGRIELAKYHTPKAIAGVPENAPSNTLGIRRIMFAVDDIDTVVTRLLAKGAELVGEVVRYGDSYRLCYMRGPEGITIALAEKLD